MRPHRRRTPLDHVILAGGLEDLIQLREEAAALAPDAYGQVVLELPAGTPLPELSLPSRFTVYRVDRDDDRPGAALAGVVETWRSEWALDEPTADRTVRVWIGMIATPDVI
ncbi:MAG: hypothetical protein QM572_01725 [Nocardioides sp.]|uniref:hypothetical protein n=1 Tax=Nocardioides sp. TaxID=35761 RepID=UPI0039E4AF31